MENDRRPSEMQMPSAHDVFDRSARAVPLGTVLQESTGDNMTNGETARLDVRLGDRRSWMCGVAGAAVASSASGAMLSGCATPSVPGTSESAGALKLKIPAGGRMLDARMYKARAPKPRGLVFAIHGGGYSSKYFDSNGQSALALVAELGFNAIAIDRPGYLANSDWNIGFDDQVTVLMEAAAWAQTQFGVLGVPPFLYGHSIGGMLALLMANKAPERCIGISMTGSGAAYHERVIAALKARIVNMKVHDFAPESARIAAFLAPAGSFDPNVGRLDPERDVPTLVTDLREAVQWTERFPMEAARAKVPVQFVNGQHDGLWRADAVGMAGIRERFAQVPFADVSTQRFSGHCIELQYLWRAHVVKVIGFAEECLMLRTRPSASVV